MSTNDLYYAALDLITQFGGVGNYVAVTTGEYIPGVGQTNTELSQSTRMALVDLTLQSNGLSLKYGTDIKAGDKEAYVIPPVKAGGSAITINPGQDKVIFGGTTYKVVTFKEINPTGSDPLVYFLYLRL